MEDQIMSREEIKEIVAEVINRLADDPGEAPRPACIFNDSGPCDVTTDYGINEES
jgi:hypothetical protein